MKKVLLAVALLWPHALPAVELAINCGGPARDAAGRRYAADRPYEVANGSGHVGGTRGSWPVAVAVGGGGDRQLYRDWREGASFAYWFDVPDGTYAVTLQLAEMEPALPGSRRTSFVVEGERVARDVEVAAIAGRQYAVELRYLATVRDGRLEVSISASPAERLAPNAALHAITVVPVAQPDLVPPAPPPGLAAHPGFGASIVRWSRGTEPDLKGYIVTRRDAAGERLLTASPTPLPRFVDATATGPAIYLVRSVDLAGNASDAAQVAAPAPLPASGGTLPRIDLVLDEANLAFLLRDPFRDIAAHGKYVEGPHEIPARIRNRGRSTRYFAKPGLKVTFKGGWQSTLGREQLNLKGEPHSSTLLEERLALDLFRYAGSPSPSPRPVWLSLAGVDAGLYLDVEQVDGAFLARSGLAPGSPAWKAGDFRMRAAARFDESLRSFPRRGGQPADDETLWRLLQELASVNEGDLDDWIVERFDLPELLGFLAAAAVTANNFDGESFYLAMDRATGRFRLVPWDLNNRAFGMADPEEPPVVDDAVLPNAMQATGPGNSRFNLLFTRLLQAPRSRRLLASRIAELAAVAASARFRGHVAAAHEQIAESAIADLRKKGWEDPTWFLAGPARFEQFLAGREAHLRGLLPRVRDPLGALALGELAVTGCAGILDEAGDADPWIEIVNRTAHARDAGGLWLTDDLEDRQRFRIPYGSLVPAGGRLVIWADGEVAEGPLHASFRLDPHAGGLALSDDDATLDMVVHGAQIPGVSYGRDPAAEERWTFQAIPTPGAANAPGSHGRRPISRLFHAPAFPLPGEEVTVLARVEPAQLVKAIVVAACDGDFETQLLVDDGSHGDGAAGDGLYGARLSPRGAATEVSYYVEATYTGAEPTLLRSPMDAPRATQAYRVATLVPPRIYVNEVVPANVSGATDEAGQHSDWVELWNGDARAVDLGGMYLSDDPDAPRKWMIPEGTRLPPGGRTLVWLDGAVDEGSAHASFRVKARGDQLLLTHRAEAGGILVDRVDFPALGPDVAWARCPDGGPFAAGPPSPRRPNPPCTTGFW